MMRKAVVAGMGIQGVPIAYGMHALGFAVTGVDVSERNLSDAWNQLESLGADVELVRSDATDLSRLRERPDVLISALPFHLNYEVARQCVENGIRYCDLGGNVAISNSINALAEESAVVPVMTDLGLAPGIANIIIEIGVRKLGGADSVRIRVGGLPVKPKGRLKYGLTFSPQGLYNEYHEQCHVIRGGERRTVEPLTEVEALHFDEVGELEAFNTSGGIASTLDSMLTAGVKECDYKTIRFPGHCEIARFLLFELGIPKEIFEQAILEACGFIREDQVLMLFHAERGEEMRETRFRVLHDERFTAMQKTTGFGAAAVAGILGSGKMDRVKAAKYADVPTDEFLANLKKMLPELNISP